MKEMILTTEKRYYFILLIKNFIFIIYNIYINSKEIIPT